MDTQAYQDACKKVQTEKPKDNYLLCVFSWDTKIVLPYKAGMAFMEALNQAERLVEDYDKPPAIRPLEREHVRVTTLSAKEYEQIRIAQLLKVPLDTVREYETNTA